MTFSSTVLMFELKIPTMDSNRRLKISTVGVNLDLVRVNLDLIPTMKKNMDLRSSPLGINVDLRSLAMGEGESWCHSKGCRANTIGYPCLIIVL